MFDICQGARSGNPTRGISVVGQEIAVHLVSFLFLHLHSSALLSSQCYGTSKANLDVARVAKRVQIDFSASGCPNEDNVAQTWWTRGNDSAIFADIMQTICSAVKSGNGTRNQVTACCGSGSTCQPSQCIPPVRWVTDCHNNRKDALEERIDCGGPFCAACSEALLFDLAEDAVKHGLLWNHVGNPTFQLLTNRTVSGKDGGVIILQEKAGNVTAASMTTAQPINGFRYLSFESQTSFSASSLARAAVEIKVSEQGPWTQLFRVSSGLSWREFSFTTDDPFLLEGKEEEGEQPVWLRFNFTAPAPATQSIGWLLDNIRVMGPCPAGEGLNVARTGCTSWNSVGNQCQSCPPGQEPDPLGAFCVTPTCTDNLQNGDEIGVDCGGSCGHCVSFTRVFFDDGQDNTPTMRTFVLQGVPLTQAWIRVSDRTYSGTSAWFARDEPQTTITTLQTPVLEGMIKAVWMNYDTEPAGVFEPWDALYLQYRREDLSTWENVNEQKIGGNSSGWILKKFDLLEKLHPLARYQFRFAMVSDFSYDAPQYKGFWLDNIEFISGYCAPGKGIGFANAGVSTATSRSCQQCPAGQYSSVGDVYCHLCEGRAEMPTLQQDGCMPCASTQIVVGGQCIECPSGQVPDPSRMQCIVPTCSDGFMNGRETDTDCGAPGCSDCSNPIFTYDMEDTVGEDLKCNAHGWTLISGDTGAFSGRSYWATVGLPSDPAVSTNSTLLKINPLLDLSRLSFWHSLNLQACCSHASVEYSVDDKEHWHPTFLVPPPFKLFRWTIKASRGGLSVVVPDLAESVNDDVTISTSLGGNFGERLVDGDLSRTWSAELNLAAGHSAVFVTVAFSAPTTIDEYEFWLPTSAANDPYTWEWAGSDDGVRLEKLNWVVGDPLPPNNFLRPGSARRRPMQPYFTGRSDGWEHVDIDFRGLPVGVPVHLRWNLHHQANEDFYPDMVGEASGTVCEPCPENTVSAVKAWTCTMCDATKGELPAPDRSTCLTCTDNEVVQIDQVPQSHILLVKEPLCECLPGFQKSASVSNETSCEDVNECIDNPCSSHGTCENIPGSFICTCQGGFWGNGRVCIVPRCDDGLRSGDEEGVDCGMAACGRECAKTVLWDDAENGGVDWLYWTDPAGLSVSWKREMNYAWSLSYVYRVPTADGHAASSFISPPVSNPRALSFRHVFDVASSLGRGTVSVVQVTGRESIDALATASWIVLASFTDRMDVNQYWSYAYFPLNTLPHIDGETEPIKYRFRFQLTSSSGTEGEGWLIDDIRVFGGPDGACPKGKGSNTFGIGSGFCVGCPPSWVSHQNTLDCSYCAALDGFIPNDDKSACKQCSQWERVEWIEEGINVFADPSIASGSKSLPEPTDATTVQCQACPKGKDSSLYVTNCVDYSCFDQRQNGLENDVDCGGDCQSCLAPVFFDNFDADNYDASAMGWVLNGSASWAQWTFLSVARTRKGFPGFHNPYRARDWGSETESNLTTPFLAQAHRLEYWQHFNMEDEDPQKETPFGCWDFGQVWAQAEDNETWINIKAPMCQTTNWEKVSIKLALPRADKVKYRD
eukprot:g13075.t1